MHKGGGVMGCIPRSIHELSRCLFDGGMALLRMRGTRNDIGEGSLEFLDEFLIWLLGALSVGEEGRKVISTPYFQRDYLQAKHSTYLLRIILKQRY